MRRVLLTGASGYLGSHLIRELAGSWRIVATSRSPRSTASDIEWLQIRDETRGLAAAVAQTSPDLAIHAAFTNRRPSGVSEEAYLAGTLHTHASFFRSCAEATVPLILISSSAVYGPGQATRALTEDAPNRPVSIYGVAKALQELVCDYARTTHDLQVCTLRPFNMVGPGPGGGTVVHDWMTRLAAIAGGAEPVLRVKNCATSRDFVDVRDVARAVRLAAEQFSAGTVYNVASGTAVSLRDLGHFLATLCPVSFEIVESQSSPSSNDVLVQYGDTRRIARDLGWRAEIDWQESVADTWKTFWPPVPPAGTYA